MDVPYFIKEPLWMNAFDEATHKKNFGGSKPSSKLSLYHGRGYCDDSQRCG